MSEITLGYYTPFNKKIQVNEYKRWQAMSADFKACYAYGAPDGTMNFWVVYDGYIYYCNDKEQLESIKNQLKYMDMCEDFCARTV